MNELLGFHHFYLGLILCLAGFLIAFYGKIKKKKGLLVLGLILIALGCFAILDDTVQHFFDVKTPLAWANDWLWEHSGAYRWLCGLADKILGKG